MRAPLFALGLLLFAVACSTARERSPAATAAPMTRTELYFGLNKQHGGTVSDAEWSAFTDTVLSRVFAQGLTELRSEGHWYDPTEQRMESERSRMVITINAMTPRLDAAIDTVRARYCRYFDQYIVLRVDQRVEMK